MSEKGFGSHPLKPLTLGQEHERTCAAQQPRPAGYGKHASQASATSTLNETTVRRETALKAD